MANAIIYDEEKVKTLLGEALFKVWNNLCARIEQSYDMEILFGGGGKKWVYELKYRRGGKTLCALYANEGVAGFMVIFGKAERERFEERRSDFSAEIQKAYDESTTYHDGKWIMFMPKDDSPFDDYMKLLTIKRRPNVK